MEKLEDLAVAVAEALSLGSLLGGHWQSVQSRNAIRVLKLNDHRETTAPMTSSASASPLASLPAVTSSK